jgi:hypothetical protein
MAGISAGKLSIEIVAEIARLQADLDKAKRAVAAASGDIAKSAKYANDNLAGLNGGMARSAPSAKQAAFGMRNLAFQAQDLGVQFAMAANSSQPLKGAFMALIMQGPQIKDAIDQTGKSLVGLAAGFARAHPLLLALTVAIGAAAGALKLFQSEIENSAELDKYAASLGLTSEEMKKLEGVGITTTDMFKGLWRTIDQGLGASEVFASIKAWAVDTFKTAMDWSKSFGAAAYAVFAGTGNAALAMGKAAKLALSGDFAGALATIREIPDGYRDAFDNAKKAMDGFLADWRRNTIEAAKERISAQASKLIDERKLEKEGKEKGGFLADVMSGAFIARWALEMSHHPIVDMKAIFSGRTLSDAVRAQEEVQRQKEEGDRRLQDFYRDWAREARDKFVSVAHEFADIVGGRLGDSIARMASVLDRFVPGLTKQLGDMLKGVGGWLGSVLKGAGIGGAAAGVVGGSAMGGMVGGALGQGVGTMLAPMLGQLGAFAGPLGAIAGGILGGVVGGLLKKTKKASATIEIMAGDAVQSSLTGNSSKLKATAGAMADSLIGGLMSIADQLGGMLGDGIRVSIGQRNKKFRVDLQGLGRTKNMPSFDTQEEAVAYAIQEVIRQGAIVGLRAGTETLLKGQGDLEAQLQKALTFENVFREIEQRANPAKASMSELTKQFENLIDIFEEAGASAADYAQLQQLMADKQREIIEQAFEPIRTMLDDLKAKATEAGDRVRTAFDAVIQREADAVAAYQAAIEAKQQAARQKAIESLQDSLSTLRSEAQAFGDAAARLRDFSATVFGTPSLAALRANFARTASKAQGGNLDALGALPGAGQPLRLALWPLHAIRYLLAGFPVPEGCDARQRWPRRRS